MLRPMTAVSKQGLYRNRKLLGIVNMLCQISGEIKLQHKITSLYTQNHFKSHNTDQFVLIGTCSW